MKSIKDLTFGFSDAENYRRRENRELLNHLFLRGDDLDDILSPSTSFLIGDKGTGKTAYAVFMANNNYKNTFAAVRYIRETEYLKFITLKKEKHLGLSDYASIWKVIIYLLLSQQIYQQLSSHGLLTTFRKFAVLQAAIDEYYLHAFSPEIIHALRFVQESKLAAELLAKHAKLLGEMSENVTFSESRFQTNLLYIQKNFETTLASLKLRDNFLVFIDGIDIRPASVPYGEYLECIKGLANAVWEINNDFFPGIRDSPGRLRAILLIRPDIYASLGLQNQNTKIRDNAVLLNWETTYRDHRSSRLFQVSDRMLSHDQKDSLDIGDAWDHYFPWDAPTETDRFERPSSFISFLRFAYHRPRDVVTMLSILQERFNETSQDKSRAFTIQDFDDPVFRRLYAEHLLGEVKDQLSFYYSSTDYEIFVKFFEYLSGSNAFTYDEYLRAFRSHVEYISRAAVPVPKFMASADEFLQFLYELNVISYKERTETGKSFIHWSFRDRSYSNISPKVKAGESYEIFYGMAKALNTGKRFKRARR